MDKTECEVPGTSVKKKRNPQTRDYMAAHMEATGLGLGSSRSMERSLYTAKRSIALKEQGHEKEAEILQNAINTSKRGAYEIARMADEIILSLCQVVIAGEARNLIEAHRIVKDIIKKDNGEEDKPITLSRVKNDMYRLTSGHNKVSMLLSAQDLLELGEIIQSNIAELQKKASEDPGTSAE